MVIFNLIERSNDRVKWHVSCILTWRSSILNESPTRSSPKRKRRSWESKQVNDGGTAAENVMDRHDEDMLWMESFNSIIAAERLGSSSAAYSPRNTNPNNNDSDWYYDYYMSCSNLNNNNIAAFTW